MQDDTNKTLAAVTTPADDATNRGRRELVAQILGLAAGGIAINALAGCTAQTDETDEDGPLGEAALAVSSGTATVMWADKTADLRLLSGANGNVAVLKGATAIGDGGGGVFYWSTTTAVDNGGTILNQNGFGGAAQAGWRRVYSGSVDITWFGASTSSSVNSTPAVINALKAIAGSGGTVVVPPGVFYMMTPLVFPPTITKPVRLVGCGLSSTLSFSQLANGPLYSAIECGNLSDVEIADLSIIAADGSVGRLVYAYVDAPPNTSNVRIKRCRLSGLTGAQHDGAPLAAILFNGVDDCVIEDNIISNCGFASGFGAAGSIGILISEAYDTVRARVVGNTVDGATKLGAGIGVYNNTGALIANNTVRNITAATGATAQGYGIFIYKTETPFQTRTGAASTARIECNYVNATAGTGIYIKSTPYSTVIGNTVDGCCTIQLDTSLCVGGVAGNSPSTTISNNVIRNSSQHGIQVQGPDQVVSGNAISSVAHEGITLRSDTSVPCQGTVVSNNTIDGATRGIAGTWPGAVNNCVISANNISNVGDGIFLTPGSARSNRVSGNLVRAGSDYGIYISDSANTGASVTYADVLGNTVDGFPGGIVVMGAASDVRQNRVLGTSTLWMSVTGVGSTVSDNRGGGALTGVAQPLTNGGTVAVSTVSTSEVRGSDVIRLSRTGGGGAFGELYYGNISVGSGFTIYSTSPTDTSVVYWEIIN